MILATQCNGPDRAFNRVGVELDATVMQEARQTFPARESISAGAGAAKLAMAHSPIVDVPTKNAN